MKAKVAPSTVVQNMDMGKGPVGRQNPGGDKHQGHAHSSEKITTHHRGSKAKK